MQPDIVFVSESIPELRIARGVERALANGRLRVRHVLGAACDRALPDDLANRGVIVMPQWLSGADWRALTSSSAEDVQAAAGAVETLFTATGLRGDVVVVFSAATGLTRAFLADARRRNAAGILAQSTLCLDAGELLPAATPMPARIGVAGPAMVRSLARSRGYPPQRVTICGLPALLPAARADGRARRVVFLLAGDGLRRAAPAALRTLADTVARLAAAVPDAHRLVVVDRPLAGALAPHLPDAAVLDLPGGGAGCPALSSSDLVVAATLDALPAARAAGAATILLDIGLLPECHLPRFRHPPVLRATEEAAAEIAARHLDGFTPEDGAGADEGGLHVFGLDYVTGVRDLIIDTLRDIVPGHDFKGLVDAAPTQGAVVAHEPHRCFRYYGPGVESCYEIRDALWAAKGPEGRVTFLTHETDTRYGVARPMWYYASLATALALREVEVLEIAPGTDMASLIDRLSGSRFVVVNSLGLFTLVDGMAALAAALGPDRMAVYLHETEYGLSTFLRDDPARFEVFARLLADVPVLCASKKQQALLQRSFKASRTRVLYYTSHPELGIEPPLRDIGPPQGRRIRIVMAGSLQERKGVSLFSAAADLAHARGLDWEFAWLGASGPFTRNVNQSANVRWYDCHLSDADLFEFIRGCDVFLLSSFDDPFPLVVIEALRAFRRLVAFQAVGPAEVLAPLSGGTAIFPRHEPEAVLDAVAAALSTPVDVAGYQRLIQLMSPASFVRRFEEAFTWIAETRSAAVPLNAA